MEVSENKITNKKILIVGGTGSLGYELCSRYIANNKIIIYSRDECKHWKMNMDFNSNDNLKFIIGNIRNKAKLQQSLCRIKPDIIILAAALKHIDKCEYETNECINTNIIGTQNVLDVIESNLSLLDNLESICFISTDKACSPVNIYGMSKAISECLVIEKAKYIVNHNKNSKNIKFVCVRYGNVLNSRGSIIPTLHRIGNDDNYTHYKLTHPNMTRFIMTLQQSVDLIEHAILYADSGDIVIPKLVSCKIIDMIKIFSEKYNKSIVISGLRPGEKMLESLINHTQSMRIEIKDNGYTYIKPSWNTKNNNLDIKDYNSTINPMNQEELKNYLIKLNLLQ